MKGDAIFESAVAADALDHMTREELRQRAHWVSLEAGLKAMGIAGLFSVSGTLAAIKYSPWFRKSTGTSSRTATMLMPAVFVFAFVSEQTASRLAHPEAYERFKDIKQEPFLLRMKRTVDESPAQFLAMAALPAVGGIFYLNGRNTHLTFSQRVMHTRVMGQATVLLLLTGVAGYHFLVDDPEEHKRHIPRKAAEHEASA
mmetsp:Transcript_17200/g.25478  ORF Transcript_17200/g.25478 Transcript_17200/m.25478 type:complete len:200 (-) Transcript_17200:63-662(-)